VGDLGAPAWIAPVRPRGPFDVVVSGFAIHHLPDARKRALYGEVFDLLGPGGLFVNLEHVASASAWGEAISDDRIVDALYAHHAATAPGRTRAEIAAEYHHRPDKAANVLAPVEAQCAWLRALGFVEVDCFFKLFELAVFGGRKPG
jgi:hypothetical protein